jgi:crotonobetainyl-CoA:carnitine CoA-transferase CaiB-like acyl-CoA transferase
LTVLNHQWERFAQDMGKPELLTDERFNPYTARWENRHALEPIIENWLRSLGSRDEVLKFLLDRHYLAAPVQDLRQTVELIKREGRGALQNLTVPGYGDIPLPKVPYVFSDTKVEFPPLLSMVGEDNREILSHYLGYSEEKLDALQAAGILIEDAELPEIRARRK